MKVAGLTLKQAFALVALDDIDERGGPKEVALRMEELGFTSDSITWRSNVGQTLHHIGVGAGKWASRADDPTRPMLYNDQPAMTYYDGDRRRGDVWSPFYLTRAGKEWVKEHRARVIALGQATQPAPPAGTGQVECPECGSAILNVGRHQEYHQAMADLREALQRAQDARTTEVRATKRNKPPRVS